MLSQITFTTHAKEGLTLEEHIKIGAKNDAICKSLGFTGRIFANEIQNFNIIEGETDRVEDYYSAFKNDPRIKFSLLHFSKKITTREFNEYQVWGYYSKFQLDFPSQIHSLTAHSFESSIPHNLSFRLRLLLEGYVHENLKSAA